LSLYADVARDGNWSGGGLIFGFYNATIYEIYTGCNIDVTTLGTADTDGTLDNFYSVGLNNVTLPNDGSTVLILLGNSCNPYIASIVGAQFAIDNVRTTSGEPDWYLYN